MVGFGFANLWGRQIAAAQEAAGAGADQGERLSTGEASQASSGEPAAADDLAATAKWDPTQFAAALDIVLSAYGSGATR